ncbi:prenyltransferase/squalene oxidase repeat-containing protein [Actinomadura rubrisoli]|nr:prenyltransferase/squalene oxidase repeat-containing protein [Actinomadura rubrisoli]
MTLAKTRMAEHLAGRIRPDGGIPGPCASRVLESALLLVLLRRVESDLPAQARLVRYLRNVPTDASRFDRALSDAVLTGKRTEAAWVHEEMLRDFDHFTAARKRLQFDVFMALTGAIPFDPQMWPDLIGTESRVRWVSMSMTAIKVIVSSALGRPGMVSESERAELIEMLASLVPGRVWENHVTAHLIALLALSVFAPDHPLMAKGVDALLRCQNGDGGIASIADLTYFTTGTAGLALARGGTDREAILRTGDYVAAAQLPGGGWSFGENAVQADVDTTSYAVSFLATADRFRYRVALESAGAYLTAMANQDGGFPTYVHGDPSEVAMTGGAASALGWAGETHAEVLEHAADYLLAAQLDDGTFERSWTLSEANAIWRAMWALHALPPSRSGAIASRRESAVARSTRFLTQAQNADGGWGYRPGDASDTASTAYSVLALSAMGRRLARDPVVRRGTFHLMARQDDDGGLSGIPDQVAPRPLPFDAPVFADTWGLLALASCDRDWGW